MKKILFVFHAKAGHGGIKNHLLEIISSFNQADYSVTVMTTLHQGHAREIVRDYGSDFDMILASGGDGTINEVVNGVLELPEKKPIAYIPTGTTNDYAASLGIPKEISSCIENIIIGNTFTADVGKLNERAFVYVAAMGTPVKVTYTTSQEDKNTWGYAAYVNELLKVLPKIRSYHLKIRSGEFEREGDYLLVFVSNAYTVSGIKGVTGKNVALDDGLFEVTLVKNAKPLAALIGPLATLFSEQPDPRYIERFQTDHLTIDCEEEVEWNLDGEFGGRAKHTEMKVMSSAVTIYV